MIRLCTLFDYHYAEKGLAWLGSVRQHTPDADVTILALDDAVAQMFLGDPAVRLLRLADLEAQDARLLVAKSNRSLSEYYWTLASVLMDWCLARWDSIAYMDADTFVFSDLQPLYDEVGAAAVAITPHRLHPKYVARLGGNGTYNVGWVYANQRGRACVREWADLCLDWCYERQEAGKFCDQGYWDALVPKHKVHVVRNLGANLAPWNAENYTYSWEPWNRTLWVSDGSRMDALIFFHFHRHVSASDRSGDYPIPQAVIEHVYQPYEDALAFTYERENAV